MSENRVSMPPISDDIYADSEESLDDKNWDFEEIEPSEQQSLEDLNEESDIEEDSEDSFESGLEEDESSYGSSAVTDTDSKSEIRSKEDDEDEDEEDSEDEDEKDRSSKSLKSRLSELNKPTKIVLGVVSVIILGILVLALVSAFSGSKLKDLEATYPDGGKVTVSDLKKDNDSNSISGKVSNEGDVIARDLKVRFVSDEKEICKVDIKKIDIGSEESFSTDCSEPLKEQKDLKGELVIE